MADVAEHYAEEEWESHACEVGGIDLFVQRDSVSVYDLLEHARELIGLDQRGRIDFGVGDISYLELHLVHIADPILVDRIEQHMPRVWGP